jgi:hypothetical protein
MNFIDSMPVWDWPIDSHRKVLGQQTTNQEAQNQYFSSSNAVPMFQQCFSTEFIQHYCNLVNPNVTKLIREGHARTNNFPNPGLNDNPHVYWQALARERARSGAHVLRGLMKEKFGDVKRNILKCAEGERIPLFLVVVGTIIASNATRYLPYIEVSVYKIFSVGPVAVRAAHFVISAFH